MACPTTTSDLTPILPFLPTSADCPRDKIDLEVILFLIYKVIVIISWAAEVAAIFLLIYAGFLYITAAGEENKMSLGKKIITAVVIGIAIVMLARWSLYFIISNIAVVPTNITNKIPQ